MAIQLRVVVHAIGGLHHVVVVGQYDASAGREACHVHVVAVVLLVFLASIFTQQVVVRAYMCERRHHGDDRIEQHLKVGTGVGFGMNGNGGGEMAASREAHNAHIGGVDVPGVGVAAHQAYGLLGVADWHRGVAVWHAVLQHDGSNAHVVEEWCPLCAFIVHAQMLITASRAYHHGTTCGFLGCGEKDFQHWHIGGIATLARHFAFPQINVKTLLRRHGNRYDHHAQCEQYSSCVHCCCYIDLYYYLIINEWNNIHISFQSLAKIMIFL